MHGGWRVWCGGGVHGGVQEEGVLASRLLGSSFAARRSASSAASQSSYCSAICACSYSCAAVSGAAARFFALLAPDLFCLPLPPAMMRRSVEGAMRRSPAQQQRRLH